MFARGKPSTLLSPFVSYKGKTIVNMLPGTMKKGFFFIVPYEWAQEAEVLHYTKLERFARDKPSILLFPFVKYKKW